MQEHATWTPEQVGEWIALAQKLPEYSKYFVENEVSGSILQFLTEDNLKELGIQKLGHRKQIELAIKALANSNIEEEKPRPEKRKLERQTYERPTKKPRLIAPPPPKKYQQKVATTSVQHTSFLPSRASSSQGATPTTTTTTTSNMFSSLSAVDEMDGVSKFCDICFDDVNTRDMYKLSSCGHEICKPCLTRYLHTQLENNTVPLEVCIK